MSAASGGYYLPKPTHWPIIGSIGLLTLAFGFVLTMNGYAPGPWLMLTGALTIVLMLFGWFGTVVHESQGGAYNQQVDGSFRMGMGWFIFSEVMFFSGFFFALFYLREVAVPLIGHDHLLWPGFHAAWPTSGPMGAPFTPMDAWGIPAINTLLLLTSGATVTWAHWGLLKENRKQLIFGLILTIALGVTFIGLQAFEYYRAYTQFGMSLKAGVYGATFFLLTGFHGFHVTLGVIMLSTILARSIKGHFTPEHHFAFEAVAWYWHFVDVVWLFLFVFVYWL
ncbi:MAG: cytochrome c oxidase subunit 3 [Acidiferrobacteraceae bacterium]